MHTVRLQTLSDEIRVTAHQLQKALGKTDTGINRDTLVRLSGSQNPDPSSGRQTLRKALDTLAGSGTANGQTFTHEILEAWAYFQKLASRTQRQHLAKKSSQPIKRKS